ncbi:hypothetical protein GPALN_011108 [Globodera pallida]|nr:hypothetical protein GPALN_011108 [Globodera pallida]
MSDPEEYTDEEEEEEEEEEAPPAKETKKSESPKGMEGKETAEIPVDKMSPALAPQALEAKEEQPKLRRAPPPQQKEPEAEEQTEAEKAMMAAKKRHEEEEAAKLLDFEEKRRQEKDQMDKELSELRERQIRRKEERKQEEAEMAARRRQDEERRRKDEEERKAKAEVDKTKREEDKRKRQQMMAGAFVGGAADEAGQKTETGGSILRKGPSKAQQEEAKRNYMSIVNRPVDVSNMLPNDIKAKIKQLHARIAKLESEKYDLEKLQERQQYDVKELGERQKQHARQKALQSGMDPSEMEENSSRPPKVRVASKFDRQTDRRGYGERRNKFEHPPTKSGLKIAHGSGRPPSEWGRKETEELEQIRKNLEPPKYHEQVKAEGAKPPVRVIPMQLPTDNGVPMSEEGEIETENALGKAAKAKVPRPDEPGWRETVSRKDETPVAAKKTAKGPPSTAERTVQFISSIVFTSAKQQKASSIHRLSSPTDLLPSCPKKKNRNSELLLLVLNNCASRFHYPSSSLCSPSSNSLRPLLPFSCGPSPSRRPPHRRQLPPSPISPRRPTQTQPPPTPQHYHGQFQRRLTDDVLSDCQRRHYISPFLPKKQLQPKQSQQRSANQQEAEAVLGDPSADEEVESLLQLYGVRKAGSLERRQEEVPSVTNSWASRYLRERKTIVHQQQTKNEAGTSLEEEGEQRQHQQEDDTKTGKEQFRERLLNAHQTVDQLLKKRGIDTDFKKERDLLLRQYEELLAAADAELEAELGRTRKGGNGRREPSVASSSDSGLSEDYSEREKAQLDGQPTEKESEVKVEETLSRKEAKEATEAKVKCRRHREKEKCERRLREREERKVEIELRGNGGKSEESESTQKVMVEKRRAIIERKLNNSRTKRETKSEKDKEGEQQKRNRQQRKKEEEREKIEEKKESGEKVKGPQQERKEETKEEKESEMRKRNQPQGRKEEQMKEEEKETLQLLLGESEVGTTGGRGKGNEFEGPLSANNARRKGRVDQKDNKREGTDTGGANGQRKKEGQKGGVAKNEEGQRGGQKGGVAKGHKGQKGGVAKNEEGQRGGQKGGVAKMRKDREEDRREESQRMRKDREEDRREESQRMRKDREEDRREESQRMRKDREEDRREESQRMRKDREEESQNKRELEESKTAEADKEGEQLIVRELVKEQLARKKPAKDAQEVRELLQNMRGTLRRVLTEKPKKPRLTLTEKQRKERAEGGKTTRVKGKGAQRGRETAKGLEAERQRTRGTVERGEGRESGVKDDESRADGRKGDAGALPPPSSRHLPPGHFSPSFSSQPQPLLAHRQEADTPRHRRLPPANESNPSPSAAFIAMSNRRQVGWRMAELWSRLTAHLSEAELAELDQRLVDELRRVRQVVRPEWLLFRPTFCVKCALCEQLACPEGCGTQWPHLLHFLVPDQLELDPDRLDLAQLLSAKRLLLRRLLRHAAQPPLGGRCPHAVSPLFVLHRRALRHVNRTLIRQHNETAAAFRRKMIKRPPKWVPRWRSGGNDRSDEEVEEESIAADEVTTQEVAPKEEEKPAAEPELEVEAPEEKEEAEEEEVPGSPEAAASAPKEEFRRTSVTESVAPTAQLRRAPPPQPKPPAEESMTEAEAAMLAVKKRHEEEEEAKMRDNDERRRQELAAVEDELRVLKDRQAERRAEREKEEAEFAERRRHDEERRRKEEEERKARLESEKAKREEDKRKRQLMMAGGFGGFVAADADGAGKNFVIPEKNEKGQQGMPGQPSKPRGLSKEQQEEAKRNYMSIVNRPVDVSNMLPNDIKAKIKQLHARIVKLESEKYDLEKRKGRQEYDMKELSERQKQHARAKALETGVDPSEVETSGNFPPKVRVASKFDRQTDHRAYGQRRELFENPPQTPEPTIAHGSGRPPTEWGRKEFEELENIRKNLEPPKYVEQVKAEGDAAKPPVPVIPLQLPADEGLPAAAPVDAAPPPPEKPRRGVKA